MALTGRRSVQRPLCSIPVAIHPSIHTLSPCCYRNRAQDHAYYSPIHPPSTEGNLKQRGKPQITTHGRPTTREGKPAAAQFRPASRPIHMISRDISTGIEWTRRSTTPRDQHTIPSFDGRTFFSRTLCAEKGKNGSVVGQHGRDIRPSSARPGVAGAPTYRLTPGSAAECSPTSLISSRRRRERQRAY
jgi:hypothetical protein